MSKQRVPSCIMNTNLVDVVDVLSGRDRPPEIFFILGIHVPRVKLYDNALAQAHDMHVSYRFTSSKMMVADDSRPVLTNVLNSSPSMTWPVGLRGFEARTTSRPWVRMSFRICSTSSLYLFSASKLKIVRRSVSRCQIGHTQSERARDA